MTTSEKEIDFATTSSPTDHEEDEDEDDFGKEAHRRTPEYNRAIKNGSLDLLRGPAPGAFVGGHGAVGDFHYRIT